MSYMTEELQQIVNWVENRKNLSIAIANNIRNRRQELGMTQEKLAQLTKKKQPDIARLERPSYGRHTINSLVRIATALDTTVVYLVTIKESNE